MVSLDVEEVVTMGGCGGMSRSSCVSCGTRISVSSWSSFRQKGHLNPHLLKQAKRNSCLQHPRYTLVTDDVIGSKQMGHSFSSIFI